MTDTPKPAPPVDLDALRLDARAPNGLSRQARERILAAADELARLRLLVESRAIERDQLRLDLAAADAIWRSDTDRFNERAAEYERRIHSLDKTLAAAKAERDDRRQSLVNELTATLRGRGLWAPENGADLITAVAKAIDTLQSALREREADVGQMRATLIRLRGYADDGLRTASAAGPIREATEQAKQSLSILLREGGPASAAPTGGEPAVERECNFCHEWFADDSDAFVMLGSVDPTGGPLTIVRLCRSCAVVANANGEHIDTASGTAAHREAAGEVSGTLEKPNRLDPQPVPDPMRAAKTFRNNADPDPAPAARGEVCPTCGFDCGEHVPAPPPPSPAAPASGVERVALTAAQTMRLVGAELIAQADRIIEAARGSSADGEG